MRERERGGEREGERGGEGGRERGREREREREAVSIGVDASMIIPPSLPSSHCRRQLQLKSISHSLPKTTGRHNKVRKGKAASHHHQMRDCDTPYTIFLDMRVQHPVAKHILCPHSSRHF